MEVTTPAIPNLKSSEAETLDFPLKLSSIKKTQSAEMA
jgi:hypothetical protein